MQWDARHCCKPLYQDAGKSNCDGEGARACCACLWSASRVSLLRPGRAKSEYWGIVPMINAQPTRITTIVTTVSKWFLKGQLVTGFWKHSNMTLSHPIDSGRAPLDVTVWTSSFFSSSCQTKIIYLRMNVGPWCYMWDWIGWFWWYPGGVR